MKKILGFFTIMVLAASFMWFGVAKAVDARGGSSVDVAQDEIIDSSVYLAGQEINVQGTIEGDLFCVGQYVEISGTVEGDVICAGQTVTISGVVAGNVRAAGQIVTIDADVTDSATVMGMEIETTQQSLIGRDTTALGQAITLAGTLGRDVLAMGDTVDSSAQIGRNLDVNANEINLNSSATVGGNFTYTSEADAVVATGVAITGTTQHNYPEQTQTEENKDQYAYVKSVIGDFFSYLLLGLILLLVAPRTFRATENSFKNHSLASFFTGFIGAISIPILAILFIISYFGTILGIALLMAYVITFMIALVYASYALGSFIVEKAKWHNGGWDIYLKFVVGLVVFTVIGIIPVVGSVIIVLAVIWAAGALWHSIFKNRQLAQRSNKKAHEDEKPKIEKPKQ